ncbi:hypothetical protein [Candidatus Leptofilum sp.]|uniref:hypothetical protein n=1 Tax=Candidatus Leptofilum sp. TaxID=3241576 RepID=UPI003B5CBD4E
MKKESTRPAFLFISLLLGFGLLVLNIAFVAQRAPTAVAAESGTAPQIDLLSWEGTENPFWFTFRVFEAMPNTTYTVTTIHHTDIPYPQATFTVTTDAAGLASGRVWSACMYNDAFTGTARISLGQSGTELAVSPDLDCQNLSGVADFGSNLATKPSEISWIYKPGSGNIEIWLEDRDGRSNLTGSGRILSAQGYDSGNLPLSDGGNGRYTLTWTPPNNPDVLYRVQLTLDDASGGHSGIDGFIKMSGRSAWIWGEANETGNPEIWALLTNGDFNGNGLGDRDEWLAFFDAPHGDESAYASAAYLSVYPYINPTGYTEAEAFQNFLTVAHQNGLKVEALTGTFEWVNSDALLQEGKDTCDAILAFNQAGATAAERFDGIHLDVEHDVWEEDNRWNRFLELLAYCRAAIDVYNQTHDPIILNADIPPRFVTGAHNSGEIMSNWDVMMQLDVLTLMDYRDYADVRWDGRTDGILHWAEGFINDGNALGVPVIIGLELTPNSYDHVTFQEECTGYMEQELEAVALALSTSWAFQGFALHDYAWWQLNQCRVYLPAINR